MEDYSCRGCLVKGDCDYEHMAETSKCPCMICLVKGVCQKICDDHNQFTERFRRGEIKGK